MAEPVPILWTPTLALGAAARALLAGGLVLGAGAAAGCRDAGAGAEAARVQDEAPAREAAAERSPVDLRGVGYDRGRRDAPVAVIEFSDYGCPYCARFSLETFPSLSAEFIEPGTVRWKYVPIVIGGFPNGVAATRAAECAASQGEDRFWAMSRLLYDRQGAWRVPADATELFRGWARELGLDAAAFRACDEEERVHDRIRQSNAAAARLGVRATPTFFVNGVRIEGALPLDQFRRALRAAAGEPDGGR